MLGAASLNLGQASRFLLLAIPAIAWTACYAVPAPAGVLGDAADETRKPEPPSAPPSPPRESRNERRDECHDDDDEGFGQLIFELTAGLFLRSVFGTSYEETTLNESGEVVVETRRAPRGRGDSFAPFPYADGTPGIVVPTGWMNTTPFPFSARLAIEYGNDFDTLDRVGGTALVESSSGFGFDVSANLYSEDFVLDGRDRLGVGDANLLLRVIQTERTIWRLGIGANWLADSIDEETGINFTLRTDFFPVKPFILSGEMDVGKIGSADTFHGRASAGINIEQTEFFIGYDYRSIGDADLEGPMLGLQFWY
jgi:hypothetical protein